MSTTSNIAPPRKGRTPTGYVFEVPRTTDMFQTLLTPRKWGPAELLTLLFMAVQTLSVPFVSILPTSFYVLAFAFWRASYNIGLAKLLHSQSNTNAVTNWVQTCSPSARALINWAVTKSMSDDYAWQKLPPSFNAWLAFRALSMVVLSNDGFSYSLLALSCFNPLHTSSIIQLIVCFSAGFALCILSFWSKAAAHHVLGDFAWYWGDFFFTVDGTLTFDGVFELFPHPMYTVGYAAYYGAALICRSYTLLAVSLAAHIAQLLFLALVEEPHIRKIYAPKPAESASTPSQTQEAVLQSLATGSPQAFNEFISAAPQRPVFMALSMVFGIVLILSASAKPSFGLVVLLLLCCRATHWIGLSFFLEKAKDSSENRWMHWYQKTGYSSSQAYSSWQHIFLASYLLNHALFLIATVAAGSSVWHMSSISKTVSHILAGSSLITVAVISVASSWKSIGVFGFFYGDFFVQPQCQQLKTSGSFRYVSNPEATLGYLAYYGLALIKQSRALFLLGVACQIMELSFIDRIESQFIKQKYKVNQRSTALETAALKLPFVSLIARYMHQAAVRAVDTVQDVQTKHGQTLRREMAVRKERFEANLNKTIAKARDRHFERGTQKLKSKAESVVGELSCDKLVSVLENRGIVVERVSQGIVEPELVAASS